MDVSNCSWVDDGGDNKPVMCRSCEQVYWLQQRVSGGCDGKWGGEMMESWEQLLGRPWTLSSAASVEWWGTALDFWPGQCMTFIPGKVISRRSWERWRLAKGLGTWARPQPTISLQGYHKPLPDLTVVSTLTAEAAPKGCPEGRDCWWKPPEFPALPYRATLSKETSLTHIQPCTLHSR